MLYSHLFLFYAFLSVSFSLYPPEASSSSQSADKPTIRSSCGGGKVGRIGRGIDRHRAVLRQIKNRVSANLNSKFMPQIRQKTFLQRLRAQKSSSSFRGITVYIFIYNSTWVGVFVVVVVAVVIVAIFTMG